MSDIVFDMPASGPWEVRGGWVVNALIREFILTREQSAGCVGNLGFESSGFEQLREIGQPEGRGGYGWAQWTADRREAFLKWCDDNELDWRSDEANYNFLVHELKTSRKRDLSYVRKTTTLEAAVFTFGYWFERPGGTTKTFLPGYDDRLNYAQRALAGSQAPASAIPDDHIGNVIAVFNESSRLLQTLLQARGLYKDAIDGDFGPNSYAALKNYLNTKQ